MNHKRAGADSACGSALKRSEFGAVSLSMGGNSNECCRTPMDDLRRTGDRSRAPTIRPALGRLIRPAPRMRIWSFQTRWQLPAHPTVNWFGTLVLPQPGKDFRDRLRKGTTGTGWFDADCQLTVGRTFRQRTSRWAEGRRASDLHFESRAQADRQLQTRINEFANASRSSLPQYNLPPSL